MLTINHSTKENNNMINNTINTHNNIIRIACFIMLTVFNIMFLTIITSTQAYADTDNADLTPMYRLYNPNSGEHFYTSSKEERTSVLNAGWNDEGIGWSAPNPQRFNAVPIIPVYRLYNANGGEHHYTTSKNEHDVLISVGWRDEGIGWYSLKNNSRRFVMLKREYNPNAFANNHNYTVSTFEHTTLVNVHKWRDEGNAWYGVASFNANFWDGYSTKKNEQGKTVPKFASEQSIAYGTSATPPRLPSRLGHTFIGWDKPYTNNTRDPGTITAQWKINTYKVTFTDGYGNTLKTQTVEYDKNATPPTPPSREGYKFNGWDKPYNNIKTNTVINAKWKENKPPVLSGNPPIDNHVLQYSYELRALSTETYNTNEYYGIPCALFYIKTNQPDYHNIFLYDGSSYLQLVDNDNGDDYYNDNYSPYGGVLTQYMNTSKPSFIDKTRLNGYIVNLPLKNNYALYELKNGKLSKIHDLNNASMVTVKDANTETQNWFNRIRQEYMKNVSDMNLQNADSATRYKQALWPILKNIRDNQSYHGYQYNNQHIENEGVELIQKGGKKSTGLWFFDHAPDWDLSQTYPRIGAELITKVMDNEVEEAYGMCDGLTGYTKPFTKPGYDDDTLKHGYTYVRFKDDPKNQGWYYTRLFILSGDRDEELNATQYNQLRNDTTNWIINSNDRKCW